MKKDWTPLHVASRNGHLDIVKWLVEEKEVDPLCQDENGWTPLHDASSNGHLDIMRWLVDDKQVDPSCRDSNGWTPLHSTSLYGHLDVVRWLVDRKQVDPSCRSEKGHTPLQAACQNGHMDIARWLVDDRQVDPSCKDKNGWTSLYSASLHGHSDIMQWLINQKQVDPSCQNETGNTPLHAAVQYGSLDIVKWLVDGKQVDPLCRNIWGSTPLHVASQYDHLDILKWLIDEKQVDPSCQDEDGWTPVHAASLFGNLDIVRWLVDEKLVSPSCQDEKGRTSVQVASFNGHFDIVRWLVDEKQVDPSCRDEKGLSPLHVASQNGHLDIVRWLVDEKQVDPSCQDEDGHTPLYMASSNGHIKIVRWLDEKHADPSYPDSVSLPELANDDHVAIEYLYLDINDTPRLHGIDGLEGQSYSQYTPSRLHGVDVIGVTTLSVTNEAQTFHWEDYGLKLHIPPASLPAGVGPSSIDIKASLAGEFQFPENTTLVSAVYWLWCSTKFAKPLTLEIQHCGKHSGDLSFVRAKCSQKDLPYQFKPLQSPRGVFSPHHCYGSVTLSSFSGLGITQEGSEEQQYCARLYYFGNRIDWRVHFVVIKDLEAFITVVNQTYKIKGAIEGPDQDIEFEEDKITMEILEGGSITIGGWTIIALTPPMIIKKKVDSYKSGRRIPSCQLQVKWTKDQPPVHFQTRVNLYGVKEPLNYITIQSDPLPSDADNLVKSKEPPLHQAITQDSGKQEAATDEEAPVPSLKALSAVVAPVRDWYTLGVQLEVPDHRLDEIEHNHPRNVSRCKLEMLKCWLASSQQPSWQNLATALRNMDHSSIAENMESRAS